MSQPASPPSPPPGFPAMSIAQAHERLTAPGQMFELTEYARDGITYKAYKNAPPTLRELFDFAQLHGPKTYLVHEQERASFDAHRRAAIAFAHRLQAEGLNKGDRVAIIMRNLPEWSAAFWGCALAGMIAAPLNAWWTAGELEYALIDCGARLAVLDAERWERVREHLRNCPALEKVYVARLMEEAIDPPLRRWEEVTGPVENWGDLPVQAWPEMPLAPDDPLAIFYTSGTTGKPKGAVLSHRGVISNMFNALAAQARAYLRRGEMPPSPDPMAPPKAFLVSVPLFHATGCFAVMTPAMLAGQKLVLIRKWDADRALELIEEERITHFGGVPTIAWQIVEHPRFAHYDTSSVEVVSYGGAPAAPELVRRIKACFPKAQPGQGWGMTETSATAVSNFAEDYALRPWSCGVPAPSGEAKIVGPDGQALPNGEVGELLYKGPINAQGYWQKPQASAETFVEGWVKTGDLASMDEEGFIRIVDRAKDMLIRGGENIYCVEVENALYEHPAVMDAALVGIAHPSLGEVPAAVVTLKPGTEASEAELRQWVGQRLAAFKVPVKVVFSAQTLPRNPQGKILKRELKSLVE
jgi:long-chain acyl-CoA synthetase